MTTKRRKSEASWPAAGSIFSFVPADSASRAGSVAQQLSRTLTEDPGVAVLLADFDRRDHSVWRANEAPRRLDGRTWGAFISEGDSGGTQVLHAREVHPCHLGPLLDYAREHYTIVCADLTGATEAHAAEVLRASTAIFVVGSAQRSSIEGVCEKASWLRRIDVADRCALLLDRVPHGLSRDEAEEITGLPLCCFVENDADILHLATWLTANALAGSECEEDVLALAG
ncbi:MAG TPA: hypothetical protein VNX18_08575 [Bryobacteraceae bacterium]|nr:hypothetical protein [Bryobacteraceae bacterium]